jgi:EAL domain-containing protein (putative c-di-GMP-specific phosphodiesterase class I)
VIALTTAEKTGRTAGAAAAAPRPVFSFAFQPIVDAEASTIVSYEALIRGRNNEPAGSIFSKVLPADMHGFDADTRIAAVELAARLGIQCSLNLNFLPRSVRISDAPIRRTVDAAMRCGLSIDRIVLEVTEGEMIDDQAHFIALVNQYRGEGMKVSIDDFGAGYAGLNLLADFQPDQVKLDMNLVRGIESKGPRQAIVRAIVQACGDLGIDVLAEGVETLNEYRWFRDQGVRLFQGYLLAKPGFEQLSGYAHPPA